MELVGDGQPLGHCFLKNGGEACAGLPLERFTEQEAERLGVVAERGPRRPPRHRLSEECTHVIPLAQLLGRQIRRQPRHARLVHQDMSHSHLPFAMRRELGPHLGQKQVVVERADRHENIHKAAEDALGGRSGEEQVAGGDGCATDRIGDAALCVDDQRAVLDHGGLEADLITIRDALV